MTGRRLYDLIMWVLTFVGAFLFLLLILAALGF